MSAEAQIVNHNLSGLKIADFPFMLHLFDKTVLGGILTAAEHRLIAARGEEVRQTMRCRYETQKRQCANILIRPTLLPTAVLSLL